MKNLILNTTAALILSAGAVHTMNAQTINETVVSFQKQHVNGFTGDYDIPKADMVKIAETYFKENVKGKRVKNKDFFQYAGVKWAPISLEKADIYYKVEGDKKKSRLVLMVSKGYNNYVQSSSDPQVAAEVKGFLTGFQKEVDKYSLASRVMAQKTMITKLEKEHRSLLDEEARLKKKVNDLERDMKNNQDKYFAKDEEIKKSKLILEEMQAGQ